LTPGREDVMMYKGTLDSIPMGGSEASVLIGCLAWDWYASGPEVQGDSQVEATRSPTGLPSRITTPEGGLLKLATMGQVVTLTSLDRACLCARVAAENKGRDIIVLDMRGITPLYDFFVIATGSSRRQIHTITEEVEARWRDRNDVRLSVEGYEASSWVVQDYGDIMVHVFDPQKREYYAIEDLWADAPRIDWETHEIDEIDEVEEI
jgi:ribosome-associated protein